MTIIAPPINPVQSDTLKIQRIINRNEITPCKLSDGRISVVGANRMLQGGEIESERKRSGVTPGYMPTDSR
jgi:RNase H-fold protein (predicted Holliday junction resolvase)